MKIYNRPVKNSIQVVYDRYWNGTIVPVTVWVVMEDV